MYIFIKKGKQLMMFYIDYSIFLSPKIYYYRKRVKSIMIIRQGIKKLLRL